ncbi:MAG: sigma-70 family RNA polymerase sigma factor [Nitrospira sp.]
MITPTVEWDERALLMHYRGWILSVAMDLTRRDGWRAQDLAQEGWIEMWRRVKEGRWNKRMPLDLALKVAAKDRMQTVLRNWRSMKNPAVTRVPLDELLQTHDSLVEALGLAETLAGVEWAYHHGEIYRVISEVLSQREREYVILRFWCGYRLPEMREWFGYNPSSLWRTARSKLREALGSLDSTLDSQVPSGPVRV